MFGRGVEGQEPPSHTPQESEASGSVEHGGPVEPVDEQTTERVRERRTDGRA